jgi:hypothetical protein
MLYCPLRYFARYGGVERGDDGGLMVKETASGEGGGAACTVAEIGIPIGAPVVVLAAPGTAAAVAVWGVLADG